MAKKTNKLKVTVAYRSNIMEYYRWQCENMSDKELENWIDRCISIKHRFINDILVYNARRQAFKKTSRRNTE